MGQTSSSTCATTSPALSSDNNHNLGSEYGYPHQASNAYPPSSQTEGDTPAPPPSDGYRWRKYGQKSVKGSAYARNYYKCTYPGCTVKKQVDKINHNGKIVDQVLCKGEHCHGPPQITRINAHDQQTFRNSVINESLANTEIMVKQEEPPRLLGYGAEGGVHHAGHVGHAGHGVNGHVGNGGHGGVNGGHAGGHGGHGRRGANHASMGGQEAFPVASSLYQLSYEPHTAGYNSAELVHPAGNKNELSILKPNTPNVPTPETTNGANTESNGKNNDHESISKSTLASSNTLISPTTTVSSPRLVIETNTNVDCLDDGYHWRKYGQKTVKGSPFPRSYYKCTEKGCSVKKQVEQNGTSIVNTYEGTHTHLAPAMDDNSDLVKKRRSRRSEPEMNTPHKRLHTSLDDISNDKSGSPSPSDNTQPNTSSNTQFHTPMPIGSMGSILHHTSHLQTMNQLPPPLPNLYSGPPVVAASSPFDSRPSSSASSSHFADSRPSSSASSSSFASSSSSFASSSFADTRPPSFASLSAISSSKARPEPSPALAPLHSFSLTDPAPPPPSFSSNTTPISIHSLSPKPSSSETL